MIFTGRYCDTVVDHAGVHHVHPWRSNLVVATCDLLLAALLRRQEGIAGILFWAVGEGEREWDARLPSPRTTNTRLARELARQALRADQIVYLDPSGNPSEAPTARLEVTAEFAGSDFGAEGTQALREFGLFGGDATEAPDTGFMINQVIHPRIDLGPEDTLLRRLQLTVGGGQVGREAVVGFGGALPVTSLHGVGTVYAEALDAAGIRTIRALSHINPQRRIAGIPAVTLLEFRAKARMVQHLQIDVAPFAALSGRSISSLLLTPPRTIVQELPDSGITVGAVARLQDELAVLQVALDEDSLQRITLGELLSS
ncbi:MAG: hypothetical protein H0U67_02255 [Gemmatimonadetes bacterium]|nr:hypothetical protein [Gemmatimonadota bacterium]